MRSMTERFSQEEYLHLGAMQAAHNREFLKGLPSDQQAGFRKFERRPRHFPVFRSEDQVEKFMAEVDQRENLARQVMKNQLAARWGSNVTDDQMRKAGIATSLGYNFYDLRAPVFLQYPVNTFLRNQIAREGPINAGVGVAAHWKGTTNVGTQPISIPEGFRAPIRVPNEVDYTSTYKEFGVDSSMTFTAQWAGEGLTDNLADDHLRSLQALWLGEEGTILCGNGGTVTNGFALGTPATPVAGAQDTTAGSLTTGNTITVACAFITAMGWPSTNQYGYGAAHTVSGGLIPTQALSSAVGEAFNMPGGTSQVSALSTTATMTGSNTEVTFSVAKKPGAVACAWFVSTSASATLANAFLYAISTTESGSSTSPKFTLTVQTTTAQSSYAASSTGLNTDYSANPLEFTGLLGMVANLAGTWKIGNNWTDLAGASFTAMGHGKVLEIENILENSFANWQAGYTDIIGSYDAITALSAAVVASGSANTGYQFVVSRDQQNNITGGSVVSGYLSRYAVDSPTGANVIPLRMHPMMPPGTLYFHCGRNPYPQSRIGNVLAALIQRDYYSIEWPVTSRDWTFGTYVQYVLAHRLPWIPAVLTGIGPYSGS